MYQVLLVDDDLAYLSAAEDYLKRHEVGFTCRFALGSAEALHILQSEVIDLVLSDLDMPQMSGELLLQHISYEWPSTLRFLVTGRIESISAFRLFGVAHQLLSKDTPLAEIFSLCEGALRLREKIHSPDVLHCINRFDSVPLLPESFVRVTEILKKEDFYQHELIDIVSRDLTLSSEILRVANSAYFGARKKISSLELALNLLGTSSVKKYHYLCRALQTTLRLPKQLFDVAELWEHSVSVANIASLMARKFGLSVEERETTFSAALLHDLGKIVLAKMRPRTIAKLLSSPETLMLRLTKRRWRFLALLTTKLGLTCLRPGVSHYRLSMRSPITTTISKLVL
jgi:response regulator RpfG family c-di-GMP phosphodiesterase